jgi:hypothetical protein
MYRLALRLLTMPGCLRYREALSMSSTTPHPCLLISAKRRKPPILVFDDDTPRLMTQQRFLARRVKAVPIGEGNNALRDSLSYGFRSASDGTYLSVFAASKLHLACRASRCNERVVLPWTTGGWSVNLGILNSFDYDRLAGRQDSQLEPGGLSHAV